MWFPAVVTVPPAEQLVTLADARVQVRVEADDDSYDADLAPKLAAAISHVEQYTGLALSPRTVEVHCTSFRDFEHLTVGPIRSIVTVAYRSPAGIDQALDQAEYELRAYGIEASIAPAFGRQFPTIATGSHIKVIAEIGYGGDDMPMPEGVRSAILITLASLFEKRENEIAPGWTVVDVLLCNHRLGL